MAPTTPHAGQSEEAAVKVEGGVSAESLRDTQAGGAPEARGGALFAYQSGSRPLDGYTIKRGVGRGGFGEVYYATSDAGKEVALKLVRRNLEVELRGMTQCLNLKHPNLISLYDIRQDGHEAYWVVMEYVAGEGLEQILARHPNGLPQEEAVQCMRQVCAGVAYLHDRGIVHRDLKPGNIFLDEGTYKIGDYGLSKFISHSRRSGQTESIGTVHYMAPEIANGRYGKEIDTYALGVIFYEMLTGHVPYEGESIGEVLMKHLTAEPDLSLVPVHFRPIVARLLRKDPDHRYPNVPALLEDIDAALSGKPLSADNASAQAPIAAPRREAHVPMAAQAGPKRLRASSKECIFSGVCGGFANYLGTDPVWIRLGVVLVTVLASGIPILIYFVLAIIMPSDEEDAAEAASPAPSSGIHVDPAALREFSLDLVRAFVSILFAVGVGCLASGLAVMLLGWGNDAVYWIGPSAGLLTASLAIATLCRSGSAAFRALAVLFFAAALGMGVASFTLLLAMHKDVAAFLGVGTAVATAAIGLTCFFYRLPHLLWRLAASLFSGVGSGLLIAGLVLDLSYNSTEMAAFLATGTGFAMADLAAFALFFGPLSPAAQKRRALQAPRATQVWAGESSAGEATPDNVKKLPRALIVAAVIVGLIPAVLFVLYGLRFSDVRSYPPTTLSHCSAPGCPRAATVYFASPPYAGSKDYCDAHAHQAAWEAQQSHRQFSVVDVITGQQRAGFDQGIPATRTAKE
jgi:phage shock protein PspC (stress-responsive transcriptional regulator)